MLTAAERNQPCVTCHQGTARIGWHAEAHDRSGVACTDCHTAHQERDAVLVKGTEAEVCYACHKKQRADFQKPSAHPVRHGLMACSDCHNAHGSTTVAMLAKPTLNQTCFSCHADKRGPMLWEHAPVAEDCSLCHAAARRAPRAPAQQDAAAAVPAVPRAGRSSVGRRAPARRCPGGPAGGSIFLVAGSCTNCHSQVHGSNHPAGAKLMR